MFMYPNLTPQPVRSVEQRCTRCHKWFSLQPEQVKQLEALWRNAELMTRVDGIPMMDCACTNCKHKQHTTPIGKYDMPIPYQQMNQRITQACQRVILAPNAKLDAKFLVSAIQANANRVAVSHEHN